MITTGCHWKERPSIHREKKARVMLDADTVSDSAYGLADTDLRLQCRSW